MGWTALISPITSILDKVIPDKDKARELAHEITTMAEDHSHEINMGQIEVNKVEAASKSLFVAGWRPFVGWVCAIALLYVSLLEPFIRLIATVAGYSGEFPQIDTNITLQVLLGMLGLGGMRSFEKYKRVAREK
jgi:hypothetical protein